MASDPVCGNNIHPKCSEWLVEYRGNVFHFCTSNCRDKFVENPQEFIVEEFAVEAVQAEVLSKATEKPKKTQIAFA
jgi:YHS domain-containing protein